MTQAPARLQMRNWQIEVRVAGESADDALCVTLHTLEPGYVAMPLRRCAARTLVLQGVEGALTVQVGERVVTLKPGETLAVARGEWHTFWNAGAKPLRFQETAAPAGLERYYEALAPLIPRGGSPDVERVFALSGPHGLEFDMDSLVDIIERHHVRLV